MNDYERTTGTRHNSREQSGSPIDPPPGYACAVVFWMLAIGGLIVAVGLLFDYLSKGF